MTTLAIPQELDERLHAFSEQLMPASGAADTLEGEIVRAINKVMYRYYNDGDYWFEGYGTETAGPAVAFLVSMAIPHSLRVNLVKDFDASDNTSDNIYERALFNAIEHIVDYIDTLDGDYSPNKHYDMQSFDAKYNWGDDDDY